MFNSKTFITLIGLAVVLFALSSQSISNAISEPFLNFPRMALSSPEQITRSRCGKKITSTSKPLNYAAGMDRFVSTPSFQGVLPPRIMSSSYGANIKYNMPSQNNLALDNQNPLAFGNMAKCNYTRENFQNNNSGNNSGKKTNYDEAIGDVYKNDQFEDLSPNGIIGGTDMTNINALGEEQQTYNYDRLIFSTSKSRLSALGDPIRGDLPIIPNNCGWFSPSVNPARDLATGAINVIAGNDNETANKLAQLRQVATDFTATPAAGVAQPYKMISQATAQKVNRSYNMALSQQGSTVNVSNEYQLPSPMRQVIAFP
jgi:hypothetical protein